MIKALLTSNGACEDLKQVQTREIEALTRAYATPEHKEAVKAFLEKRKPDFRAAASAAASGN
jgi:1,4-dihydroxy-2-naphthoyl-CoA synthase